MRLFLVRHGQTVANLEKRYVGPNETPLTELGKEQARAIAPILREIKFDKVYSSNIGRAIETAKLALDGREPIQTPYLREFDEGTLMGKTIAERNAIYGGDPVKRWDYSVVGGESADQVCARLRLFLDELEKDPCENVIAFSHNGVLGSMLRLVVDANIEPLAVRSNNCAIHVFEFDGAMWRLIAWNYGVKLS